MTTPYAWTDSERAAVLAALVVELKTANERISELEHILDQRQAVFDGRAAVRHANTAARIQAHFAAQPLPDRVPYGWEGLVEENARLRGELQRVEFYLRQHSCHKCGHTGQFHDKHSTVIGVRRALGFASGALPIPHEEE